MTEMAPPSGSVGPGSAVTTLDPTTPRHSAASRRPRLTRRRKVALSLLLLAIAAVLALVGTSLAAWTVSLSNSGNSLSTNTILLQDNQGGQAGTATSSGTAIFNVTNLEPNSPATTQCI